MNQPQLRSNAVPATNGMRKPAIAAAFCAALAACSGNSPPNPTCNVATIYPSVQLVYPIPGATAVPVGLTVLLYNVASNSSSLTSVPIGLAIGASAPVSTVPAPLPAPLPSPTATPAFATFTTSAVSLSTLASATTYQVIATQYLDVCGTKTGKTQQANIGSFTTVGSPSP